MPAAAAEAIQIPAARDGALPEFERHLHDDGLDREVEHCRSGTTEPPNAQAFQANATSAIPWCRNGPAAAGPCILASHGCRGETPYDTQRRTRPRHDTGLIVIGLSLEPTR